jgi:hypothetical protein
MRSRSCLYVCVSVYPPIVARQRLGKNPVYVQYVFWRKCCDFLDKQNRSVCYLQEITLCINFLTCFVFVSVSILKYFPLAGITKLTASLHSWIDETCK